MMGLELAAGFAWRHWKLILGAMMIAALVVMLNIRTHQRDKARQLAKETQAAFDTTVANYRAAAEKARADDLANVARVTAQQQAITERVVDEYQDRIASADARYERLRGSAEAYRGSVREPDMSAAGQAACRAYAGTECDAIPALLKAAQDNTDQLLALQDWTRAQALVEVSDDR
jgi:acyl-CoA synthetase (AMP-forming)/AMP-acid ligase II